MNPIINLDTIILLAVALINVYTAVKMRKTSIMAEKTELNTNSMREQLVTATGLASHAAGLEEGRSEGRATAATMAQGVKQGKSEK